MAIRKNAIISDIDLCIIPHYNTSTIDITLKTEDGKLCSFSIPPTKLGVFVEIFEGDYDFSEDGVNLSSLTGKYVRIEFESDQCINPNKIGNIIRNIWLDL